MRGKLTIHRLDVRGWGRLCSGWFLAALVALMASSVEVLAERVLAGDAELDEPPGWQVQYAALAGGAAVLVAATGQWLLARNHPVGSILTCGVDAGTAR